MVRLQKLNSNVITVKQINAIFISMSWVLLQYYKLYTCTLLFLSLYISGFRAAGLFPLTKTCMQDKLLPPTVFVRTHAADDEVPGRADEGQAPATPDVQPAPPARPDVPGTSFVTPSLKDHLRFPSITLPPKKQREAMPLAISTERYIAHLKSKRQEKEYYANLSSSDSSKETPVIPYEPDAIGIADSGEENPEVPGKQDQEARADPPFSDFERAIQKCPKNQIRFPFFRPIFVN